MPKGKYIEPSEARHIDKIIIASVSTEAVIVKKIGQRVLTFSVLFLLIDALSVPEFDSLDQEIK